MQKNRHNKSDRFNKIYMRGLIVMPSFSVSAEALLINPNQTATPPICMQHNFNYVVFLYLQQPQFLNLSAMYIPRFHCINARRIYT